AAVLGSMVFVLVLNGVATEPKEALWAAVFMLAPGVIATGIALWERSEGWAVAAGPCLNCAGSLGTWHYHAGEAVNVWAILLVQLNLVASAATALVWWMAARKLNRGRAVPPGSAPLLSLQVAMPYVVNAALLSLAGVFLWHNPAAPSSLIASVGTIWE